MTGLKLRGGEVQVQGGRAHGDNFAAVSHGERDDAFALDLQAEVRCHGGGHGVCSECSPQRRPAPPVAFLASKAFSTGEHTSIPLSDKANSKDHRKQF